MCITSKNMKGKQLQARRSTFRIEFLLLDYFLEFDCTDISLELENIRMLMNFQSPYPLFVQNLSNIFHFTCKPTAENEFKTDMLIEIILHTTSKKCPWV